MLTLLIARLGAWLEFHSILRALRRLDPHLRSDLGLTETDLARIARQAVGFKGPVSLYRLVREDFGEETRLDAVHLSKSSRSHPGLAPGPSMLDARG